MGFFRRSVRHRLLAISIYRWNDRFDAVTIARVRDDLTIARQYLTRSLNRTRDRLIAVGESERFRQLLRADQGADGGFVAFLDATAKRFGFDFVYVVADDGKVIATVFHHLERIVDGGIIWAPAIEGGFVLLLRGGDFELTVGQDFSIGYLSHFAATVKLYVQETFTFRVLTTEAAVALSAE